MTAPLYVFAGGATGGHLFPGIAVAESLVEREPDARIVFLGTDRPVERDILAKTGYEHVPLLRESQRRIRQRAGGFGRAYFGAVDLLRNGKPRAVIGCGGGASVAPVLAARRLRIPVLLLEQNVIPGRATRLLSRLKTTVCLTYGETATHLPKTACTDPTGNPVRRSITLLADRSPTTDPSSGPQTLLVLGGSQGAHAINDGLLHLAEHHPECLSGWQIVHQTGQSDADRVKHGYHQLGIDAVGEPFFDDMVSHYREASLVVSRAGGTTLSELACAGLPAVLVPYPHAKDDHQTANARVFADAGAAVVISTSSDENWQSSLVSELSSLLKNNERRRAMSFAMRALARPRAADEVASMIGLRPIEYELSIQ